jgi:predicted  nucleic acid-binding Zn-ribbon protein
LRARKRPLNTHCQQWSKMPLHRAEREVKLLEIHDMSLKAAVSTTGPGGDVLSRFSRLLSDFGSLQAQYGLFQEDFEALSKDVAALGGRLERMDVLSEKVGDVQDECRDMQTRMHQADERAVGLEQRIEGLEGDVDNVHGTLEQFAEDHPLAAVIFQFEEDCLQGTSNMGANALMQEHAARMGTDAGRTSRNSRPRSRASTSASGSLEEGWIIDLPAGEHTLSEMQRRGVSERPSFGAIRVTPGFEATLFEFSNFGGKTLYLRAGDHNLTAGDTAFAKVGAIRLQRLRHSEWALREDVDQIRAQVDAQSNTFTTLRADLVSLVQNQGSESNARMEKAIGKLEAQTHQLADYCRQYNADIEHLRKTKAEKGENKDLPEQIADLRERFEALTNVVDEESRKISNKADLSMVLDKVTRDEIQEFVQAIQQLLQIGGPYAYTGHKYVSESARARERERERTREREKERKREFVRNYSKQGETVS